MVAQEAQRKAAGIQPGTNRGDLSGLAAVAPWLRFGSVSRRHHISENRCKRLPNREVTSDFGSVNASVV